MTLKRFVRHGCDRYARTTTYASSDIAALVVRLRDLLGSLDDEACFGDIVWSGSALWLGIGELTSLFEAFCDNLVGRLALENPLTASVVSGVEAAEQLLELLMGPNGDAEHLAADPAIEAFDHAVGLR